MNMDLTNDFANRAYEEYGKYILDVVISPKRLKADDYVVVSLDWKSVPYGKEHKDEVPNDKRGIYAFVICHPSKVLPQHGYVLYIGIAGRNSNRSLRKRYKDYLNDKKVRKRARIARMIGTWQDVLRFFYAPVGDGVSSGDLQELERQLNAAFMPTFSAGDFDADVKELRRAFK